MSEDDNISEDNNEVRVSIMRDTRPSLRKKYKGTINSPEYYEDGMQTAITDGDLNKFKEFGEEYKHSYKDITNNEGESLIHTCVKSKRNDILDYILDSVKKESNNQSEYVGWLERRIGKNRLTALHLASFYGNVHALRRLIDLGADPTIKTKSGLTIIHMAAQGDQPGPIVFLKESDAQMELNIQDKEGNTPLHWACISGALAAALFFTKYYPQESISIGNKKGLTPLHMAVESTIRTSNTGMLKAMLFAGANRHATDKQGRTAMDHALEAQGEGKVKPEIMRDVIRVLRDPKECECLMLKRPIKKTLPSFKLVAIFIIALVIGFFINGTIAIPRKNT